MKTRFSHVRRAGLAGAAVFFLAGASPFAAGEGAPPPDKAQRKELVRLQIVNDMMYASDDFFGDMRQIVYADQPLPPAPKAEEPKPAEGAAKPPPRPDIDGGGGDPGGGDCPT